MPISPEEAIAESRETKLSPEETAELQEFVNDIDAALRDHFDGFCMVITVAGSPKILAQAAIMYSRAGWCVDLEVLQGRPRGEDGKPLIGTQPTLAMRLKPKRLAGE